MLNDSFDDMLLMIEIGSNELNFLKIGHSPFTVCLRIKIKSTLSSLTLRTEESAETGCSLRSTTLNGLDYELSNV